MESLVAIDPRKEEPLRGVAERRPRGMLLPQVQADCGVSGGLI